LIPEAVTADTDFRQRFHREADLAATLWHPNIVGVHDRGEFGGHLWIAMDYVEGTDAAHLLKDQYPAGLPIRDVCAIVTGVAESALRAPCRRARRHFSSSPTVTRWTPTECRSTVRNQPCGLSDTRGVQ
jgi:serine/threonine protein kinase